MNQRIALLGHRGIPNSYGGFETFAEETAKGLVGFGCAVTVYCRTQYFTERPSEYRGTRLVYLPTITNKILDTFAHTFISVLHLLIYNTADVVIMVNVGNAPFAAIAKLFGKKVIFCVDGLDWQRKKWGTFARWYLRVCSYFTKWVAHEVVTDAASVQEFYARERGTVSSLIPYGTDIEHREGCDESVLQDYQLTSKNYFIYVARFEPENNPLLVVEAYVRSGSTRPLVMIGDNRYQPELVRQLKAAANDRVLFLGYVFGSRYKVLVKNALAYIRAAEVGGASPAMIEAMGRSVCVVANDKPENKEMLGDTGLLFPLETNALARVLRDVSDHPNKATELGQRASQRALLLYSWDKITYEYFKLIKKVTAQKSMSFDQVPVVSADVLTKEKKKMLILGGGGMVGDAFYEYFSRSYNLLVTSKHPTESHIVPLDVTDAVAVERLMASFAPDYVVNLAAITDLEKCEQNMALAYTVNALATKQIAQLTRRYGAKMIYISSSNVFDGMKQLYLDADEPKPNNVYGLTKQVGALVTEYYNPDHLILRAGWMMGGGPRKDKKFVAKIVEQIVAGKKIIHATNDKFGAITYAPDLAHTLEVLLQAGAQGTYNVVGKGFASRYDMAKEIVRLLGHEGSIEVIPVSSDYFAHTFTAKRPTYENLVAARLTREGKNTMRPWKVALQDYLEKDFAYAFNPAPKSAVILDLPVVKPA